MMVLTYAKDGIRISRKVVRNTVHGKETRVTVRNDDSDNEVYDINEPSAGGRWETPSITFYRTVTGRGDTRQRVIRIESWAFRDFLMEVSGMPILDTQSESVLTLNEPFVDLFHRQEAYY